MPTHQRNGLLLAHASLRGQKKLVMEPSTAPVPSPAVGWPGVYNAMRLKDQGGQYGLHQQGWHVRIPSPAAGETKAMSQQLEPIFTTFPWVRISDASCIPATS
eukprot:scaffold296732_cov17-Tisochrysis_lutea.AAC.1